MRSVSSLLCGGFLLVALGCTSPQSGLFEKEWCQPLPKGTTAYQMIDDLEDGDGVPCSKSGKWSVLGPGATTPPAGDVKSVAELFGDDLTARTPSLRALHLEGTLDPGGYASFVVPLANPDLRSFKELTFWSRTDGGTLHLRVTVATESITDPDYFGDTPEITMEWGVNSGGGNIVPNSIAFGALQTRAGRQAVTDDFAASKAVEFKLDSADNPGVSSFGFWVDDVQLKL